MKLTEAQEQMKARMKQAKMRVKAKNFRDSIPIGLAIHLPDKLIDGLSDEDLPIFLRNLNDLGIAQNKDGYWERWDRYPLPVPYELRHRLVKD